MWIIAKIKKNNLDSFRSNIKKNCGLNTVFYFPKIKYSKLYKNKFKFFKKSILENYIFCFNEKFKNFDFVNQNKYVEGLEYFLKGFYQNQEEIIKFIHYCQSYEDKEGFLKNTFFQSIINNKAKFLNGPFANMFFTIIKKQKNTMKILLNNKIITCSNNNNYLYLPA